MKLIDFEKLMEMYNNKYQEFNVYDLRFLKDEYLPIVEAIPIEWLRTWILKNVVNHGEMFDLLITDWEKEND